LAESISIETLAELAELSPFHFSRVFKQATGITPLQFVTRERMLQAQQLIRETSRSLIEIALEVGYTSPSHFAKVFRRTVGMAPTRFRNERKADGSEQPTGAYPPSCRRNLSNGSNPKASTSSISTALTPKRQSRT
jgi:AraC-like DNA-binding protein